ncbi:hypothetical protein ACLI4R_10700 [Natrialbaceae archaeon A-chndr2]
MMEHETPDKAREVLQDITEGHRVHIKVSKSVLRENPPVPPFTDRVKERLFEDKAEVVERLDEERVCIRTEQYIHRSQFPDNDEKTRFFIVDDYGAVAPHWTRFDADVPLLGTHYEVKSIQCGWVRDINIVIG